MCKFWGPLWLVCRGRSVEGPRGAQILRPTRGAIFWVCRQAPQSERVSLGSEIRSRRPDFLSVAGARICRHSITAPDPCRKARIPEAGAAVAIGCKLAAATWPGS